MTEKVIQLKDKENNNLYPVVLSKPTLLHFIDLFYPVGSYYETSDATFDPNIAWCGTWIEDTKGRVTVSKSDSGTFATVGKTGGSETHTLTIEEMPKHHHLFKRGSELLLPAIDRARTTTWGASYVEDSAYKVASADGAEDKGNDQPHNNLQPYIVVKRWHRTA